MDPSHEQHGDSTSTRVLLYAGALVSGTLAFLIWVVGWFPDLEGRPAVVTLLLATSVLCLLEYWEQAHRTYTEPVPFADSDSAAQPSEIAAGEVDLIVDESGATRLSPTQSVTFGGCVYAPSVYFREITEYIESYHRSTVIRSTFTIRLTRPPELPDAGAIDAAIPDVRIAGVGVVNADPVRESTDFDYVIPLFLPRKDALQEGVRVTDGSNKQMPVLDPATQDVFSAAVIRRMISGSPEMFRGYLAYDRQLENDVWTLITKPAYPEIEVKDAADTDPAGLEDEQTEADTDDEPKDPAKEAVTALVERLESLATDEESRAIIRTVELLLLELARHRPISISVPATAVEALNWPSTLQYTLERRFIAPVEEPPEPERIRNSTFVDTLRLALGVRLNRVYVPLTNAYRTPSYHLVVEGRKGTYFAGDKFVVPRLRPGDTLSIADLRSQPRLGQRRSHLYIRDMEGKRGAYYGARFFERAPTSFASVTVAAVVSSVLITVLFFLHLVDDPSSGQAQTRNLIPALLALPIAISTFVGLESETESRHPSLASRFIALMVTLVSLSAFVLAIWEGAGQPVPSVLWHLVLWASIATTVGSIISWLLRLSVETHFVRRVPRVNSEKGRP